jgi:hypothetical protein
MAAAVGGQLLRKVYRHPLLLSRTALILVTASAPALRHDAAATDSTRSGEGLTMPPVLQIIQQQGTGRDRHQAILTFTEEGWAPHLVTLDFRVLVIGPGP